MAENDSPPFKIALWGASSVGKTSALAAYVCSATTTWIDSQDETTAGTKRNLLLKWNRFGQSQLPIATTQPKEYELRHKQTGRMVILRDMRGGATEDLDPDDVERLRHADAAILFVGWPHGGDKSLNALNSAISLLAHSERSVLVLTKVEMHLRFEEVGLFLYDPIQQAELREFPENLVDKMKRHFQGRIFPVSVFGYQQDGLPASCMDEFGRLLPWRVAPVNIAMPFEHVLRGLV